MIIMIIVKECVVLKQGIRQGQGTAFETIIIFYAWSYLSIKHFFFARTDFHHLNMEMILYILL